MVLRGSLFWSHSEFHYQHEQHNSMNTSIIKPRVPTNRKKQISLRFISNQPWENERKYSGERSMGAFFDKASMFLPTTLGVFSNFYCCIVHEIFWMFFIRTKWIKLATCGDSCWNNDWVRLSNAQCLSLIISTQRVTHFLGIRCFSEMCLWFFRHSESRLRWRNVYIV